MMDGKTAATDLKYLDEVLARARRTVDPHAFHYIHWGAIMLLWYPLSNFLNDRGKSTEAIVVGGLSMVLGLAISAISEYRLRGSERVKAEDKSMARQIIQLVWISIGGGSLLSALGPSFGVIEGEHLPILWGIVYANIALMSGVVYRFEFFVGGLVISLGVVGAILFQGHSGYILGPTMAAGMIWPGWRAELDVRKALRERRSRPIENAS